MSYCELCGEQMPVGEEMFKYHGYSGPCPKPPKVKADAAPRPGPSAGELEELTRLVRETMKDAPPFMPCVFYHEDLNETHVLLRDCSYTEEAPDANGLSLLRANYDDQAIIGMVIPGKLRGVADPPVAAAPPPAEDHLDIYVPGTLRCPQCEFQVVSQTMFMGSGEIGMTRRQALVEDVGEPCPNDGTPMVKVRWSERAIEAERAHIKLIDDIIALTGKQSLPEALDSLKRESVAPAPPETEAKSYQRRAEESFGLLQQLFGIDQIGDDPTDYFVIVEDMLRKLAASPRPRPEDGKS